MPSRPLSDDEKKYDENPVLASVKFGGTRTFQFKHKKRKASVDRTTAACSSCAERRKHNWLHQIPKT
jgi:hypothetical protein